MLKRLALSTARLCAALAALLLAPAAIAGQPGPPIAGSVENFSRIDPSLPTPDDGFADVGGRSLSLADFRGKYVLLNVWATWCGPCVAEMPSLDRLQATLAGEGLLVLPVSLDRGGGPAVALFYGQQAITHLGVYLEGQGGLGAALKIGGVPTSFLIDPKGRIVGSLEGATQWDSPEALALIRHYLKSQASVPATQPAAYHAGAATGAQRVGVGFSPL